MQLQNFIQPQSNYPDISYSQLKDLAQELREIYEEKRIFDRAQEQQKVDSQRKNKENTNMYSFKPEINQRSRELAQNSSNQKDLFSKLYMQAAELNEKKKIAQEQFNSQEDPECVFHPKVYSSINHRQGEQNAFTRLYSFASKVKAHKEELKEYYKAQEEDKEMSQCSFKPQIYGKKQIQTQVQIKGVGNVLERQEKARKLKYDKENYFLHADEERKKKLKNIKPFKPQAPQIDTRQVLIYVDLKVSKTKTVRVPIKQNDDPIDLAKNIAKIHSLNLETQEILADLLRKQLLKYNPN